MNDAKGFLEAMQKNYNRQNKKIEFDLVLDTQATRQNIVQKLEATASRVDKNTDVILYYSGHGGQIKDLNGDEEDGMDEVLVPYDTNAKLENVIVDDELKGYFEEIAKAGRLLFIILDSCFSGSANRGAKSVDTKASYRNRDVMQNEINGINEDILFLSSSTGAQPSWSNLTADMRYSIFTYFLLIGLEGNADPNKDRKISIDDLHRYVNEKVLEFVRNNERRFEEYPDIYQTPLLQSPSGKTLYFVY